ncbi:MAG: ABC transporter ATP-binding protein, partial [Verrucomicrobia bacterium]
MPTMIRARSLCRRFGDATAVAGFDVAIERGEIFGLVGPDGAGKTTIMRMLAGVLLPSEGEAQVAGCDVVREPERVKERIAYMSQRFGLYPDLSVTENIRFYADLYGVPRADMHSRIEELLAFTGLA